MEGGVSVLKAVLVPTPGLALVSPLSPEVAPTSVPAAVPAPLLGPALLATPLRAAMPFLAFPPIVGVGRWGCASTRSGAGTGVGIRADTPVLSSSCSKEHG